MYALQVIIEDTGIGIPEENLRLREHSDNELAHYASKTVDIEFLYPWGWGELEGIANRGTFDLSSHEKASGKDLSYFDSETNEKIIPTVIEPAGGLTRTLFALLCSSYYRHFFLLPCFQTRVYE